MMQDKGKIITGIVIFLGLMTFPFWLNLGKTVNPPVAQAVQQLGEKECIEDVEYMRENHMKLLNDWRTEVVRNGNRIYVASDGQKYEMSLQNTCMECHAPGEGSDSIELSGEELASKYENSDLDSTRAGADLIDFELTDCYQCHVYAAVETDCWDCHIVD